MESDMAAGWEEVPEFVSDAPENFPWGEELVVRFGARDHVIMVPRQGDCINTDRGPDVDIDWYCDGAYFDGDHYQLIAYFTVPVKDLALAVLT